MPLREMKPYIFYNDISIPRGRKEYWVNVYDREDGSVFYGAPRNTQVGADKAIYWNKRKPIYRIRVRGK